MPISEEQLKKWSNPGAQTTAKTTHETVRKTIESPNAPHASKNFDTFLQGSYANSTNIRGDSDVDIVAMLKSTFQPDLSRLTENQKAEYHRHFSDATYSVEQFRKDVTATLKDRFDSYQIDDSGQKCVKVLPGQGRLHADVVVCLERRIYRSFSQSVTDDYIPGIEIRCPNGERVRNYPKVHKHNCEQKNQDTKELFKPFVRIVKNLRTRLVERGKLGEKTAPSYYVECLIYNVPRDVFRSAPSWQVCFTNAVSWLAKADADAFQCAHMVHKLFGDMNTQWNKPDYHRFLKTMVVAWENG